jgi:hypothetical protein
MADEAVQLPDPKKLPDELTTVNSAQWTYREVAAAKRVSVQTVQKWVGRGMIPSPTYAGATARFTPDQVRIILLGTQPPGTYPVANSVRRTSGKKGGMNAPRPNEKRPNYRDANERKIAASKKASKKAAKKKSSKRRAG